MKLIPFSPNCSHDETVFTIDGNSEAQSFYIFTSFYTSPCSNTNCDLLVLLMPCPLWCHYLIQAPHCWISVMVFMATPVLENPCHLASKTLYGNPNPWNLLGAVNMRLMVSNPAIYWSAGECKTSTLSCEDKRLFGNQVLLLTYCDIMYEQCEKSHISSAQRWNKSPTSLIVHLHAYAHYIL